jgi:hypothetical protein
MPPQKNNGNRGAKKETGVSAKNRRFKQNFLDDLRKEGEVANVHIARVLQDYGNGRMGVFYAEKVGTKEETRGKEAQAVIRGSFRGRGKHSVWIGPGSFVAVAETGVSGSAALEIVAVFSPDEMRDIASEFDVDARILAVDNTDGKQLVANKMSSSRDTGYEFETIAEDNDELDIDDI